ncbi:MAG TPA: hypothetical protein VF548_00100 [Allosphingosinicella sp.]
MAEIFDLVGNFVLNRGYARIVAWDLNSGVDGGTSFGNALTPMDGGTTLKLMKSMPRLTGPVGVATGAVNTIQQGYSYFDQLFMLVPAAGGFRAVSHSSGRCLDYDDWFFNLDRSRSNVRNLVLRPVDALSKSQIFTTQKDGRVTPAGKFVCTVKGEKFALTPNDFPAKQSVLVTLGQSFSDFFAVEIEPFPR